MQSMKFIQPFLLLPFVFTLSLWSATPVPYSGKIDIQGVNYYGEAQFAFSLHDGDGTTHWRNGKQPGETVKVTIRNGRYTVLLGGHGMTSLAPQLFLNHDKLYLKVEVDTGDEKGLRHLAPDQLITATPRALVAEVAKTARSADTAQVAQTANTVKAGAINKSMLDQDVLSDLNRTVTPQMIQPSSITAAQLNEQILKYLKPEITTQPLSNSVYSGSNAYFSVTAEGKYLSYQWKKNGSILTGETNSTLTIAEANATQHDGNYSVVVSNDFGNMESSVFPLDVNKTWITDGLVGWWEFNESSGVFASDSSGNGRDGILTNGPIWVNGKIGGAVSFDGINDFVLVSNWQGISGNAPRSICCWIKTTVGGSICSWGEDDSREKWVFKLQSENAKIGTLRTEVNDGFEIGQAVLNDDSWHFVCSILPENSSNISNIIHYFDGVMDGVITSDHKGIITKLNNPFRIGRRISISNIHKDRFFNGLIDDIRIYDRALSAAEVQALYNMGQ
jgi:hypothetical protein